MKEKILKEALKEFAENGYKSTSTNVICKKANISKGLLYHYFSTKENLYNQVLDFVLNEFKQKVKIHKSNNKKGIEYISEYFNNKFAFFSDNTDYHKILLNILIHSSTDYEKHISIEFQKYNNKLIYEVLENIEINPKYEKEMAFELIKMIGEKLEEKHMKNTNKENSAIKIVEFRKEHKIMIEMIFEGIDK